MKNNNNYFMAACAVLLLISCSKSSSDNNNNGVDTGTTSPSTGAPVETATPNTRYPSAFAGQTRVNGVRTTMAYRSAIITSSLTAPWGIAALPDGRFLVTEKAGNMRIVTPAGQVSGPLSGVPAVNAGGQGGLLGLCIDPAFATNRMVYWSFSEAGAGGNVLAVAKGRLSSGETGMEAVTVIYRATPYHTGVNQYGSRLIFDPNGYLVVSSGDRSDASVRVQAQDVSSAIGKLLRITTDGQPAPGNPFANQAGARSELYSIGHRNEHGLAFHPITGDLWEAEFGPRGGDELNRIQPGANYGWPVITYGIEYSGQPVGAGIQQQTGMEQPVYYWDPVISPSGMTFYRGKHIPEWENNLFLAALSGQHIDRLIITGNRVTGEERFLSSEGQRFRDIIQGVDSALYTITDQGRLYRIGRE